MCCIKHKSPHQSSFQCSFFITYIECQCVKVHSLKKKMYLKNSVMLTNSPHDMIKVVGNLVEPFANSIRSTKG